MAGLYGLLWHGVGSPAVNGWRLQLGWPDAVSGRLDALAFRWWKFNSGKLSSA
jgi:hypothetical protein